MKQCHFKIACDVTNPLCTEHGCVYIFGKQKGVQEHEKARMDKMMRQYADCVEEYAGKDLARHREQALREVLALRFFLDLRTWSLNPA